MDPKECPAFLLALFKEWGDPASAEKITRMKLFSCIALGLSLALIGLLRPRAVIRAIQCHKRPFPVSIVHFWLIKRFIAITFVYCWLVPRDHKDK
ncbi:MAG: hypothetical protein AB1458_00335 [Bacteroidota bacterium]